MRPFATSGTWSLPAVSRVRSAAEVREWLVDQLDENGAAAHVADEVVRFGTRGLPFGPVKMITSGQLRVEIGVSPNERATADGERRSMAIHVHYRLFVNPQIWGMPLMGIAGCSVMSVAEWTDAQRASVSIGDWVVAVLVAGGFGWIVALLNAAYAVARFKWYVIQSLEALDAAKRASLDSVGSA